METLPTDPRELIRYLQEKELNGGLRGDEYPTLDMANRHLNLQLADWKAQQASALTLQPCRTGGRSHPRGVSRPRYSSS